MSWLFPLFLFNVFVNSLLSFVTLVLIVEGLLFLFRVKSPRLRATAKLLPIFKLPFDLFLYRFTDWATVAGVDPLTAPSGSRFLHVGLTFGPQWYPQAEVQLFVNPDLRLTFSIADLVASQVPATALQLFAIAVTAATLYSLSLFVTRLRKQRLFINDVIAAAKPTRLSSTVADRLGAGFDSIFLSDQAHSPFTCGYWKPVVIVPSDLYRQLSTEELTAALAHEHAHIRWCDAAIQVVLELITALFWWVPLRTYTKRLFFVRERACDIAAHTLVGDGKPLASAIYKSAKLGNHSATLCVGLTSEHRLARRVKLLLTPYQRVPRLLTTTQATVFLLIGSTLLAGRLWIF